MEYHRSQKISHLLAATAISTLTILWIADIKVKSDRPSLAVSSDRPIHPQTQD
jgi:hypothetical protein